MGIWQIIVSVLGTVASAILLPLARKWGKKLASDAIDKAADTAVRYIDDWAKANGQVLQGSDKLNKAIDQVCAAAGVTREEAEIAVRAAYARWVETGGEAAAKKAK